MSWAYVVIPIFGSSCHMLLFVVSACFPYTFNTAYIYIYIKWRNRFQHVILYRYDRLKYDNLWHNLVSNTTSIVKSYVFLIHNWAVENPRQPHVASPFSPAITTAPKLPRAAPAGVGKKMSQSPTALMTDKTIKPVDLVQSPRTPRGVFRMEWRLVTVAGFFV